MAFITSLDGLLFDLLKGAAATLYARIWATTCSRRTLPAPSRKCPASAA